MKEERGSRTLKILEPLGRGQLTGPQTTERRFCPVRLFYRSASPNSITGLQVIDAGCCQNQRQRDGCYDDLAESSYYEWTRALLEEVFQVRAQTYSGEG